MFLYKLSKIDIQAASKKAGNEIIIRKYNVQFDQKCFSLLLHPLHSSLSLPSQFSNFSAAKQNKAKEINKNRLINKSTTARTRNFSCDTNNIYMPMPHYVQYLFPTLKSTELERSSMEKEEKSF